MQASFRSLLILIIMIFQFSCSNKQHKPDWQPLFNGKDLSNWKHFLAKPDPSIDIPELARNSKGEYLKPLGYMSSDPLKIFSMTKLEGEPVIRISGQIIGNLFTETVYKNYHLKLQFKWGNIKWDWMKGRPKDGGILYHYNRTESGLTYRHEFQIHEGDVGSYWAKNTIVDIPAYWTKNIPTSIQKAKPFLKDLVSTLNDTMLLFNQESDLYHFQGKNEWQICMANPLNEKPSGEWNTLELICYENHAIHIVNNQINMILLNGQISQDGKQSPINKGLIQLQSEGAEIFFKDIKIKPIEKMPSELKDYL